MSQVIQISKSHFDEIVARLSRLEKMMAKLFKEDKEPQEGTKEWWDWSDKKALEEYRRGEYYELRDDKELDDFFKHIDDDDYVDKYYSKSKKAGKKVAKAHSEEIPQTIAASF